MRALILEDDPVSCMLAETGLGRLGYTVTKRQSVEGARGVCYTHGPFDLYLVDVNVPETPVSSRRGDGLRFARWVRYRHPNARVIVWSADDYSAEAKAVGATFVMKGNMSALERAVRGERDPITTRH